MNNIITIFFSVDVKESNGQFTKKEYKINARPNETIKELISRFFQLTGLGLSKYSFKFYYLEKNLQNHEMSTLAQFGLVNNSKIQVSSIIPECGGDEIPNNFNVNNNYVPNYKSHFGNPIPSKNNYSVPNNNNHYNVPNIMVGQQNNYSGVYVNNTIKEILPRKSNNEYNIKNNLNPLNYSINIKFIQYSMNSVYNCNKELKGILKLCFLNEIASKINAQVLNNLFNMNKIPEIIYYILKILKNSYVDFNDRAGKVIKKVIGNEKGSNVINFSNFVEEQVNQDWLQQLINYVPQNCLSEINNIKLCLGKYENYMEFFEKELKKSLKKSIFEFSPVSLVVIDREDFDTFEREKAKCPNLCLQILYHGTQEEPISCILTGMFKRSEESGYQHGKGVYFTDSLDYCYFYGGSNDKKHNMNNIPANRYNMNRIPPVGDIFTAICSLVYYSKNGFLKVKDYTTRIKPGKNEVNFAYAAASSKTIHNPDFRRFVGTEYVIYEYEQICPLISIRFKREEFCVIWRDNNFSEKAIYGGGFDEKFKKFLKDRIKYIEQLSKYNVYTFEDTNEALKYVNRKKYNKIILISNVGTDLGGKKFVEAARQIIQNDVIVLFNAYNTQHLNWIKTYKNALFSNEPTFYEEYLNSFNDINKMRGLIAKLENHYKVKFNFDKNFLTFPLYRDQGHYSDLSF